MGQRVLLILVGVAIYGVLREYFGLPRTVAAAIGFVPFALAESKGLIGPYEKSAKEIMHETGDPKS
jgi:hypothetical protein